MRGSGAAVGSPRAPGARTAAPPPAAPARPAPAAAVAASLLGELLVTAGAVLLLFTAWQLWWTDVVAERAQAATTAELAEDWLSAGSAAVLASAEPPALEEPAPGAAFAVVHVPRFGQDWQPRPVVEGVGASDLEAGVGHYPGTALPGEVGNVALAGHRNTYGRPFHQVAELRPGDPVVLETAEGWFVYRATTSEVVRPEQVEVVAPVPGRPGAVPVERVLTLTACHPIASARERYVAHASFDRFVPRERGAPAELAATATAATGPSAGTPA
ncbi:class E sortase [uncultured Pseudokineococcus sp.]|uniref:class E sortase n=1 Tax=uncultured Pseudokineococcus sp. TaxID=1642928 RepID=UPI00261A5D60|nr:class E sortase [uncultured Pseudokineococcus sp.]